MQRIAQRDEAALTEVIDLYASGVLAISSRICGDPIEADAVVSTVFWELWAGPEKFDQQRGSLRTYLMTLARSRAIDRQRANLAQQRNSLKYAEEQCSNIAAVASIQPVDQRQLDHEQVAELRQAIEQLPHSQRTALELAFYEGLTHRQVADKQSLPLGTIKTNIRRGLIQLRNLMLEPTQKQRLA